MQVFQDFEDRLLILRNPRNPVLEVPDSGPLSSRFTLPESARELVLRETVEAEIRGETEEEIVIRARKEDRETILAALESDLGELKLPEKQRRSVLEMIRHVFDLQSP